MQHDYETEFFWRKKRLDPRRRFNLLLLEYGEIYYENLSVFQYPVPNQYMKFAESDALKVKGRLHVCSRSIIFEPAEVKRPLLKFPYKLLTTELEKFPLKPDEVQQCSTIASGFATFRCSGYFEMKDNDKVGPYRYIDCDSSSNQAAFEKNVIPESKFIFALVHTDSSAFFLTTKNLREELIKSQRGEGLTTLSFQQSEQKSAKLAAFDSSQLLDFNEKQLFPDLVNVTRVGPLVLHPGGLMVTGNRIYFQPSNLNNIGDLIQHFDVRKIKRIFSRRYLLRQIGMEIFFTDSGSGSDSNKSVSSVYFVFESNSARDNMVSIIEGLPHFPVEAKDGSESVHAMTRKWQLKEISNFDYLLYLNSEADRSFSDLTQYPIMPHIIADYESKALDLTKASSFRDLSKPIGALNPQRLKFFKERYESMSSVATEASSSGSTAFPPPFLYGTHYSTPGYVLYYLVRVAPEHMLCLQNGKFDAADRMFYSISGMYSSCLSNPADLKELIPEFFDGEGEFLSNNECLNLGRRHDGDRVDDVELPPWARNPKDFIKKSRQALECKYVSERLHHWIDLIFGYKQRGQEAFLADNLFYHLTYEGALDLDTDDGDNNGKLSKQRIMEREAIDVQIQEFGQTPKQLFSSPHPTRFGTKEDVDDMQSVKSAVKTASRPCTTTVSIDAGKISKTASPTAKVEKVVKVVEVEVSPSREQKGPVELSSSSTPQIPTANISPTNNGKSLIDMKRKSTVESSSGDDVNSRNGTNTVTSSAQATTSSNMEGRKSSSGMILLGDDFRAEVTRELLVQRGLQDRQQVEGSSVTDLILSGALVVQKKGAIRDEMKSETHNRTEDNSNSSNTFKDEMDCPGSPVVQSAVPLKSRMQSLWGSITDKTISIIRPDKSRTDSAFIPSRTGIRAGSISSMEDKVSVPSSSDASSPVSNTRSKGMFDNNNNSYNNNNGNGLYNQPSVSDTKNDDVIVGTSEIERIDLQLWMEHQLPKGLPITGLSALQVSSSTSDVSLLLCAITKDATLTILTADFNHPAVQKVSPKDSVKDLHVGEGGWQSISEKEDTLDDNQKNDIVKLISFRHRHTFNASGDSAALDMISRPLGFLPTMFTTAFLSAQGALHFPFPCCCKLSQDATKLSVFSQRGHDCHLLSYSVSDARLIDQNTFCAVTGAAASTNSKTCVMFGRSTKFFLTGSPEGIVRLRCYTSNTLHPMTLRGPSGAPEGHIFPIMDRRDTAQKAVFDILGLQSPVLCVSYTVLSSPANMMIDSSSSSSSCSSSSSSGSNDSDRLMIAAGSSDGTVAVWAVDVTSKSTKIEAYSCSMLFCHQLRPSERSVVCVNWLDSARLSEQSSACDRDHPLVLITGAVDGALHCVDPTGRVLAICEILGHEDARDESASSRPRLTVMARGRPDSSPRCSNDVIYCGFSDGSVHIVLVSRKRVQVPNSNITSADTQQHKMDTSGVGQIPSGTRDSIQITVTMVVPSPVPRCMALTAIEWIPHNKVSYILPSGGHQKDVDDRTSGTLITGDAEGSLRFFNLSILMRVI